MIVGQATAGSLPAVKALMAEGRFAEAAAIPPPAGPLQPWGLVMQGEALLRGGHSADAIAPLRAAEASDGPVHLKAGALLAEALLGAGQYVEARTEAERAAAQQTHEVRAQLAWIGAQAQALAADSDTERRAAALAMRRFWLNHPEHPSADTAREEEKKLAQLPDPAPEELVKRASALLSAGKPGAAVAQAHAAAADLRGAAAAEAHLIEARCLAADGRRNDAVPALQDAWLHGTPRVAAAAGLLLARDRARRNRDAEAIALVTQLSKKYATQPEAEEGQLLAARLELDAGKKAAGRARLAKIARAKTPNASIARWLLAWTAYRDGALDAGRHFADFAAGAESDAERAQGLYWQARASRRPDLYKRVAALDPLGWYGLLAREKLGTASPAPAPFPRPPPPVPQGALPARLELAAQLLDLGMQAEAGAETDWFVEHARPDAFVLALPLYERAARYDRALLFAEPLLGHGEPPRGILEAAYPVAFPQDVARASQRVRLDPYLVLAVMRRESAFRPEVRSAAGAVGLLQLLPATARRAAIVLGRPALKDEELTQPPVAIDLGAWYLAELVGRFGDPAVAAAAYNAGPRVALPWAAKGVGRPLDEWVEDIPYRETRRYVKIVVGAWSAYRTLAGGAPPKLADTVPAPRSGAAF